LSGLSIIKTVTAVQEIPLALYILFPVLWVGILSSFAIYDGRKYLKVVDEYSALTMASFIASISMAGILYISYRDVSRALFLAFVLIVYVLFVSWRGIARLSFRLRSDWPDAPRRILIVGSGPLGMRVAEQLEKAGIRT
jgi:FlaA1/EpsC-like NDP-sugar epimerase